MRCSQTVISAQTYERCRVLATRSHWGRPVRTPDTLDIATCPGLHSGNMSSAVRRADRESWSRSPRRVRMPLASRRRVATRTSESENSSNVHCSAARDPLRLPSRTPTNMFQTIARSRRSEIVELSTRRLLVKTARPCCPASSSRSRLRAAVARIRAHVGRRPMTVPRWGLALNPEGTIRMTRCCVTMARLPPSWNHNRLRLRTEWGPSAGE